MTLTRRLAAAALAGAAALTTAVVTAPPAQAMIRCGDNPFEFCLVLIEPRYLIPPPECKCELQLGVDPRDRVVLARVDLLLNQGVYDFRTAARTPGARERVRLEAAGTAAFTEAVGLLSVAPTLGPLPDPWLEAAGADLVAGLQATFEAVRVDDRELAEQLRRRAAESYRSFGSR